MGCPRIDAQCVCVRVCVRECVCVVFWWVNEWWWDFYCSGLSSPLGLYYHEVVLNRSSLFLLYFTHKTRGFPVKMQFICYWNFQCKKKKNPKSSPPLRARACVCMSSILHIFVRVFIRFVLRSTCALTPLALRDPLAHLRLESIFKSRVRARRVKRTTSKASKALHLYRVMRVDTSGFQEPYRLHSSFVGVTRSWTLTRADRETDLHRDLLAPRLYLENPVRAPAASR